MVARHLPPTTIDLTNPDEPLTIDLTDFDGPSADALRVAIRDAARDGVPLHLTDAGRPVAEITLIGPAVTPPSPDVPAVDPIGEGHIDEAEIRREWDEAWAARRAMTGPYVFDPVDHERVMERRNRLRAEFAKLDIPPFSAVDWVRDARRDD